ncbi:hypothetical protein MGU_08844 [Metarhizium guizhouense ARSEF 977]|uniref:Uncharacterized protein n=2 Tax=Metarhizium TaxID=5529 RepID=A0A0B4GVY8_METGA|nr:hypothetical protein MGU_08844 [Metarhizium guizhouense ARSEF 977]
MSCFFGEQWKSGVGHIVQAERQNFLLAAKSENWLCVKSYYGICMRSRTLNDNIFFNSPYINFINRGANMTNSGGFVKIPTDEEQKRMDEAARMSREKRDAAKKAREAREAAEAAGKKSQERRGAGGSSRAA